MQGQDMGPCVTGIQRSPMHPASKMVVLAAIGLNIRCTVCVHHVLPQDIGSICHNSCDGVHALLVHLATSGIWIQRCWVA